MTLDGFFFSQLPIRTKSKLMVFVLSVTWLSLPAVPQLAKLSPDNSCIISNRKHTPTDINKSRKMASLV